MIAAAGIAGLAIFGSILVRPQFAAYIWLLGNPLIVGIARGDFLPVLRPNELLLVVILAALVARTVLLMLARQPYRPRIDRLDLALILLAVTSSVLPMALRYGRGLPVSMDDILYSIVLWKYYLLYRVFRDAISTDRQVAVCLWISMASAFVVALVGMMQVGNLFGVPEFLHTYYDQPFEGHEGVMTERGTSTISSSFGFADVMIMNFVIAAALLHCKSNRKPLLAMAAGIFFAGCIAAGAFSGVIGLVVAVLVFGLMSRRLIRLLTIGIPAALVASVAFWSVVEKRLAGFESPTGLPHSWTGRWENLERFFLPELLSGFNLLIGVRPAPRLPATETWREFIYLESGYVWLFWIGGLPLAAAFVYFILVSVHDLRKVVRARTDEVAVAAFASLSYVFVITTLMLFDPHLTVRGSADLFFPLLALSLVRPRSAEATLPAKRRRYGATRLGATPAAVGVPVAFGSGQIGPPAARRRALPRPAGRVTPAPLSRQTTNHFP